MVKILDLPALQADALRELTHQAELAQQRLTLAFTMVVRGHNITEASMPHLTGNQLSITVPEET
jgi:hypothetical protein